jgi:hypothetical protein
MMVRTKPVLWIAAASFVLLLWAALLLPAPPAHGAPASSKTGSKAAADSAARAGSRDEGISVRVIEDGKQTVSTTTRSTRAKVIVEAEEAAGADPPEPPEPPELPDTAGNDLVRFGQDIVIPADKVIDGDVVAIGGDITVLGRVKGSATSVGGSVSIRDNGVVEGDAVSVGGSTTTSDSARVVGDDVSVGSWPFKRGHALPLLGLMGLGALAGIFATIVQLLLTLFFAWLCLLLVRERMEHAVDRMGSDFLKSFLWGLVGWMAMIATIPAIAVVGAIAMVILVITIIGIPVAILLAIAMVFALIAAVLAIIVGAFLGYVNGAMYLGQRLLARRHPGVAVPPLKAILVGVVLIIGLKILGKILGFVGLLFFMPIGIALGIASAVLGLVFMTAGLGAMILTRFSKGPGVAQPVAAAAGSGWYSPPPPPPTPPPSMSPSPEGGTSDAP